MAINPVQHSDRRFFVSILFGCLFLLASSTQPVALHAQTYTDLHDFARATDGAHGTFPGLLSQGRDGNLYGTLQTNGPNSGYGTVFKVTPSGSVTVIYNFSGGGDGAYPLSGVTLGTDGNLYGTTQYSQTGYGTVFKITPNGTLTTLHTFTGTNGDGYNPDGPPVLGKKGLYGVTSGYSAYSISSSVRTNH